jgi:hypothetical protein
VGEVPAVQVLFRDLQPERRMRLSPHTAVLRKAGRQRGIEAQAQRLHTIFASEYLHQLPAG